MQLDRQLQAGADVDLLQQAQLLLVGDVGAEAGGVGQSTRLLDRTQEGGDAVVGAAQLEDLFDHGAVLTRQLLGVLVIGMTVVDLLYVDAQGAIVTLLAGDRGAGQPAVQADHGRGGTAAARTAALDHLGDDADAAVLAVAAGQEEDALLITGVNRQGRGDAGENECIVKRNQEIGHS